MTVSSPPITRFAPSPTGMLHIGGGRTALFNWLFARHHKGQFLLRIEDTDRERSTPEAVDAILGGLTWLGLDWDGDIYRQSEQLARHAEVVETLLARRLAYRCYCTPEELAQMRETARAQGRPMKYDGRWRNRDPEDAPAGVAPVIRFKAPQTGQTIIRDQVQGDVTTANDQLDDLILMRSDGTPTYMLSVVVDDHDMGITHIIRGDDHLTNAARQYQIYEALEWTPPVFAHIPLIHGSDGAKLSKRHGALSIEAYRDMGYLPAAMRNYLLRLGWSHGDDEIISTAQAIEWFNLESIGKAPARLDLDKLNFINGAYLSREDDSTLTAQIVEILSKNEDLQLSERAKERLKSAMPEFKQRAKTLRDLAENIEFLVLPRPLRVSEKAAKQLGNDARHMLADLKTALASVQSWAPDSVEAALKEFADAKGLKFGAVAQPLRAALTGGAASPGIVDLLMVLGREESLGRINDQATA